VKIKRERRGGAHENRRRGKREGVIRSENLEKGKWESGGVGKISKTEPHVFFFFFFF
jgi:hypothetical protein